MKEGYRLLGDFIRQVDVRNTDGKEPLKASCLRALDPEQVHLLRSQGQEGWL